MHEHPTPVTYQPIRTQATEQIDAAVQSIARRQPTLVALARVAARNDDVLHRLVIRANAGEPDAATVIVWALLPRASGIIRSRYNGKDWRTVIDEYLGALYIAIATVSPDESPTLLAEKLLSRTRRRVARELTPNVPAPTDIEFLEPHLPTARPAEDLALAKVELDAVVTAVHTRQIPRLRQATWDRFVAHIDRDPAINSTGPDRMVAMRVARRLRAWRDEQAA